MLKITEQGINYKIEYSDDNIRNVMLRHIEHLELQLAAEREACAKICDNLHHTWRFDNTTYSASGPRECAAAIRARG